MKIGAGNAIINFDNELLPIEGFMGIHDLPKVSTVIIDDEQRRIVLVSIEIVMLSDEFIDRCRKSIAFIADVEYENVWLHMTHAITTPHAPSSKILGLGGEEIELTTEEQIDLQKRRYKKKLYEEKIFVAIVDSLKKASQLRNGTMLVGAGECDVIRGRDIKTPNGWWIGINGDVESNETMTTISFKDDFGNYVASIVSFGLKPCVIDNAEMDAGKRLISADAPGLMCRELEKKYASPILYFTGAAGDRVPYKTAWYDRLNDDGKIETIDLGVKQGIEFANEIAEQMTNAAIDIIDNAILQQDHMIYLNSDSFSWKTKQKVQMKPYRELLFNEDGETNVDVNVLALSKDLLLVGGKPEINEITERQLKEKSGYKHTLYVSMLNGGMKYMPDEKAYDQCRWEAISSMLMPGAAEAFVTKSVELLKDFSE